MKFFNTKNLALVAIIAALYVALTIAFAPICYGTIQFRVSEALTILPIFGLTAVFGLTLGCAIANIYGVFIGQTMALDIIIGTLATLIAAILTYEIGKTKSKKIKYVFGPLPTVLVNAIIVGIELTIFYKGNLFLNMFYVGVGEFLVCYTLGLVFLFAISKNNFNKKIFN